MRENGGKCPPIHPILIALSIVLVDKEDLSCISRNHPRRSHHSYYDASADFSADISDLLPPSEHRWWEILGKPRLLRFPCCPAYNLTTKSRIGTQRTCYQSPITSATTASSDSAAKGHADCYGATGPTRGDFSTAGPTR